VGKETDACATPSVVIDMKIGDLIRTIGYFKGIEGVVTHIVIGNDNDDHGCIEIRVTKSSGKQRYIKTGSDEHFAYYG
jgi:hypothetical protein